MPNNTSKNNTQKDKTLKDNTQKDKNSNDNKPLLLIPGLFANYKHEVV